MISYSSHMSGYKCFLCGKGIEIGKQHKHHPGVAGGRWKKRAPKTTKIFKPNLHVAHILIGNVKKRVRLCTKCLRMVKRTRLEASAKAQPQSQPQAAAL